jgi:hypothetical protein
LGRRHPQLADRCLVNLAGLRKRFDLHIAVAVVFREAGHHLAFAQVALVLRNRSDALIRHELQHVMQRSLAGRLVDDGAHLLRREQRPIFPFLRREDRQRQHTHHHTHSDTTKSHYALSEPWNLEPLEP